MIILSDWDKLGDEYRMVLKMGASDSIDDLPSANRPMNPEFFAVSKEYGIPAEGSVVAVGNGDTLIYKGGQWAPAFIPMPVKGDLIMLDEKQYLVLKTNDTVAEVLAMYDATKKAFGSTYIYPDSELDKYCNETFYNSLSMAMQKAITAKTFSQDLWDNLIEPEEGGIYYCGKNKRTDKYKAYYLNLNFPTIGNPINRKCYCLSVRDIIEYFEVTTSMTVDDTTLTSTAISETFWKQTGLYKDTLFWLCSAADSDVHKGNAYVINNNVGMIISAGVISSHAVRPAFQIDLSKVDWTKWE